MILTVTKLRQILPQAPEAWLEVLPGELFAAGIDQPNEIATFIAEVAHESDEFRRLEENLNYKAERLAQVWKRFAENPDEHDLVKRVPNDLALRLAHNPEGLANFVYNDEFRTAKLGNTQPGDGWRFRGRGPIQITGRNNYAKCSEALGEDLLSHPDLLLSPFVGIRSALWFWHDNKIDEIDDDEDIRLDTRRINGGGHGLERREAYFAKVKEALA